MDNMDPYNNPYPYDQYYGTAATRNSEKLLLLFWVVGLFVLY